MRFVGRDDVEHAGQRREHPAVAARPVAALAVRLGVGRIEVLIAPPQVIRLAVEAVAALDVLRIRVHRVRLVGVAGRRCRAAQLRVDRHRHLDCIHPGPVVHGAARDDHVDVGLYVAVRIAWRVHVVEIDVRLARALVVRAARGGAADEAPAVARAPADRVVDVARLRIDAVERHQTFVVHRARPDVARVRGVDLRAGIGPLADEVGVRRGAADRSRSRAPEGPTRRPRHRFATRLPLPRPVRSPRRPATSASGRTAPPLHRRRRSPRHLPLRRRRTAAPARARSAAAAARRPLPLHPSANRHHHLCPRRRPTPKRLPNRRAARTGDTAAAPRPRRRRNRAVPRRSRRAARPRAATARARSGH